MAKGWKVFSAGSPSDAPLPDYGYRYFDHVLAEYLTSPVRESSPPTRIAETLQKHHDKKTLSWADLYVLEKHILRNQPFDALRRRAWGLRANFREIIGQQAYDTYLASRPPNENDADVQEDTLRADLERLLGALHWNYSLVPIREQIRTRTIKISAFWMLASLVGLLCLLPFTIGRGHPLMATLLFVAFAGSIGGFVSLQRRIQLIPREGDPLVSILELGNGQFTLYLAPISGAVFAVVLFFAFLGDLLAGGVFPKLHDFSALASHGSFTWWDKNLAILLVWSFIAGFAERFVPDTLARLVERGRDATAPSQVPSQPAPPYAQGSPPAGGRSRSPEVTWRERPWSPP